MRYHIELSRMQHTTASVEADSLDEAFERVKSGYNAGKISPEDWQDYEDSLEVFDATDCYNEDSGKGA